MRSHASVSILANPTAAKLDLLVFKNGRISTNNKTAIKGLLFYLLWLAAISQRRPAWAFSTLTGSAATSVTHSWQPWTGTTPRAAPALTCALRGERAGGTHGLGAGRSGKRPAAGQLRGQRARAASPPGAPEADSREDPPSWQAGGGISPNLEKAQAPS